MGQTEISISNRFSEHIADLLNQLKGNRKSTVKDLIDLRRLMQTDQCNITVLHI